MKKMMFWVIGSFMFLIVCNTAAYADFQGLKQEHKTQLIYKGPSPQEWDKEPPPSNVKEVTYDSNGLKLKAWYAKPTSSKTRKLIPAVVYIHGGFAFGPGDFNDALPFFNNGFALLTPTFRGENGNKGNFELMFGEVDDALAAIQWLGKQPDIDKNRIFVFGHSSGGGISALLSLYNEPLINLTGSSGGIYKETVFLGWKEFSPFNCNNKKERQLRVLLGNTKLMKKPHIGYIGQNDSLSEYVHDAKNEIAHANAPLDVIIVQGDHYSSLGLAINKFISVIKTK